MLRAMILSFVGKSGDQDIINEAKKCFDRHIAGDLIDPNIREAVYAVVSRYGDENTQEELRKLYTVADMTEEKVRLLSAMGQSLKPEIIVNTLKFTFEGDNVRMQDSFYGLIGCTSSRDGRDLVWKFIQKNRKILAERFGEKSSYLVRFVEMGLSNFADEKIADEIKSFFDSMNTPIITRPVKKVLETIHMHSEVLKRDSKAIEEFLKQQQQ
ncbi:unnamed protein product [Adineta steineri]|uniref:ERAP1-like C-terminal domain-containing protein n=1 Tax=Adineta steineri TaxID=433720 RepID=A0A815VCU5_9BILA|nr:unnamed protein product [Adineta steineri]CAF1528904.1 unnamed protein product [Adineta steineri]